MADEANAPVATDAPQPVEETTRPADGPEESAVAEAKPSDDGDVAPTADAAKDSKPSDAKEETPAKEETAGNAKADDATPGDDAAPVADASVTNGTPASKKATNGRRKSTGAVPEHKKKTPAKKKKAAPEIRLNVQPGEMWMVAMRGYQPWPVIICDEEMLPESLISKRPVSAKRIDGTYREDFLEGGKNAKDRRYPVMFLGTNEFAWQVNTELLPFDLEEVKKDVESGNQQKKNKALWDAYQVAAEGHDLAHFKEVLANHEQAMQEDAAKKESRKGGKRKSTAAEESEDVEMEDAGEEAAPSAKKAKGAKKRKKEDDSDGENEKPAKTPKTKLKLNNKAPKEASATKPKKESKPKKTKAKSESAEAEPAPVEEPQLTEEERLQKREKSVLYLRHRLQKGFLSRDQAPKDEDMANMADYLTQLEAYKDLEAEVIKKTKVHKVLKAIIKLSSIPKEEEFAFKKRSHDLLTLWNGALAADGETAGDAPTSKSAEPTTNGVNHNEEKKSEAPAAAPETSEEKTEESEKPKDTPAAPETKTTDDDGDVSMAEAKVEEPTAKADAVPSTEGATEAPEIAAA